ncbi:MAG TPA: hypothetical protein VMP01_03090 [Pirellulaceae bacterium]|nr:hypothetical protein [Pirellulaceae bacterium]
MAKQKKPSPTFEIQLRGTAVVPEKVQLHQLNEMLSAVQRLASGHDFDESEGDEDAGDGEHEGAMSLLGVKRGSAIFQCLARNPRDAVRNLAGAGRFIDDPNADTEGKFSYSLRPIQRLSRIATSLDCEIFIRTVDDRDKILATVDSNSFHRVSTSILVSGETTLIGRVQRVGGATRMRCALRVAGMHRLLFCDVADQEVARALGNKIYEEVTLRGTARWLQRSWKLYDFRIHAIEDAPVRKPLRKALDALRNAGGKAWESIDDPSGLLESLRQ